MSARSSGGAAVSSRASVSLKRWFSLRIKPTEPSAWASNAIDVKCICIASACSICRDHPTRSWAWSRRFVCRAVSVTISRLTAVIAMKSRVMRRKPARSLICTEVRMRATARTRAPAGEANSAIMGGAIRSADDVRRMVIDSPLAGGHLQGDGGWILIAHHDVLRNRAEPLLPGLQGVAPGRQAPQLEFPGASGERVERVLGHHDPAAHPGVQIARYADDLGVRERDRDRPPLRLRAVEGGIGARGAVEVVQESVAVEEVDPPAGWHDHHAWREHAFLLVHGARGRQRLEGRRRRRLVKPDDRAANPPLRRQHKILGVFLLAADILIDRHGELPQLRRRPLQNDW